MLVAAMGIATLIPVMQWHDMRLKTETSQAHETAAADTPTRIREREWAAALQYNRTLRYMDVTGDGSTDREYTGQLDTPADGIMSVIEYPRLGIRLPVRHGSTGSTLDAGAGHVYGTSLPVGGKDTRTVISAHRGGTSRPFFTRLGEARKGDVFYLHTLDRTLAYRVTSIRTVLPSQVDAIRPEAGKDLATLLTCTPYGVNTHRLLVTGTRARMPDEAPPPSQAPKDTLPTAVGVGLAVGWTAVAGRTAWTFRRKGKTGQ